MDPATEASLEEVWGVDHDEPHLDDYSEEDLRELAALGEEILEEIDERS